MYTKRKLQISSRLWFPRTSEGTDYSDIACWTTLPDSVHTIIKRLKNKLMKRLHVALITYTYIYIYLNLCIKIYAQLSLVLWSWKQVKGNSFSWVCNKAILFHQWYQHPLMTSRIFRTITPSTLKIPQLAWYFRKPNRKKHTSNKEAQQKKTPPNKQKQFVNHGHHQNPHGPQYFPK